MPTCLEKRDHSKIETYWGWVDVIVSQPEYCLKRMWMSPHRQSSLEYHMVKSETYIVESGYLTVGLRDGKARGKNVEVRLGPGDILHIPPGTMHMRIAGDMDVSILEVSTHDDPSDTYIVEDGKVYTHTVDKEESGETVSGQCQFG